MQLRTAGLGGVWSGMADDAPWSMLLGGVDVFMFRRVADRFAQVTRKEAAGCRLGCHRADEWRYDAPLEVPAHDEDRIQSLL